MGVLIGNNTVIEVFKIILDMKRVTNLKIHLEVLITH